jgi:hypothetical protein
LPTLDPATLRVTRHALHRVAEHVLAAVQYAQTGDIRLAFVTGGFGTTRPLNGTQHLRVAGDQLVVGDSEHERSTGLTTLRAAGEFIDATPGLPGSAYPPATPFDPDAPLSIDPTMAYVLADWYGLADAALRSFADQVGGPPERPTLWPEHFDIGITLDVVNYGASPGDDLVDEPYLYVGPHAGAPVQDAFWNHGFGAALTYSEVRTVEDAVAFFRAGLDRLGALN